MRQPPPPRAALAMLVLTVLTGSAAARQAPPPKPKAKSTPGRIEALTMDGSRIAYDVAAGATHLDLAAGLAAYATGRRLHVVRLSTGKSAFGARANATVSAVQLEAAGLAYALQRGDRPGTIVFVPMARVLPRPPRR